METGKFKALAPAMLVDGVLVLAVLMLLKLDQIVNSTLYNYRLLFSLDWAVPYWTFFRISLVCLILGIGVTTVAGFISYRRAERRWDRVVFLCKSCGNAWTEVDKSVRPKKLPKFKILKICPSCESGLLDTSSSAGEALDVNVQAADLNNKPVAKKQRA